MSPWGRSSTAGPSRGGMVGLLVTRPTVVACGWDTGRMDIADFIRARLDEDEQIARAASGNTVVGEPGNWQPSPTGDEWEADSSEHGDEELLVALRPGLPRPPDVMGGYWGAIASWEDTESGVDGPRDEFQHAARHDPAAVLRDVAAKRGMIRLAFQHAAKIDGEWGCCHSAEQIEAGLCEYGPELELLQLLAAPYAAHPDYRPEWAPEDEE